MIFLSEMSLVHLEHPEPYFCLLGKDIVCFWSTDRVFWVILILDRLLTFFLGLNILSAYAFYYRPNNKVEFSDVDQYFKFQLVNCF